MNKIATFRIANSSNVAGVTFTNIEGDVKRRDLTTTLILRY
jgi:tRNA nucleotidyltransferase/poly(A) polymerase